MTGARVEMELPRRSLGGRSHEICTPHSQYDAPEADYDAPEADALVLGLVLFDVELPPGTASGPIIGGRELARLEVHSPPGH